ncbi:hypothetical protein ACFYTQ_22045 [Nocardia sp. NPDC004068]|uniref:hypothetical protein n=1 Tax=Nocardia sp. NPDC004068 TaxID=3364303 RepID=UPI0036A477F8
MPVRVMQLAMFVCLMMCPALSAPATAVGAAQLTAPGLTTTGWQARTPQPQPIQAPPSHCNDHIHFRVIRGGDEWSVRILGTDLSPVVNDDSGVAFIDYSDGNGHHDTVKIWWDNQGHPLNYRLDLAGNSADVYVSIMDHEERYIGCFSNVHLTRP